MEVKLDKEKAKRLYDRPELVKELLEEAFGKETFRKVDFRDLKTFEDLCKANGTTAAEFEAKWKDLQVSQTLKTVGKFEILSEGINQGWKPNTLDKTQKKWAPYFTVSSSGLDFSGSFCNSDSAGASVGFPFCFETKEQSDYAGQQFIQLWEELILRKIA